jgi:serine/threonine protein kinase/Tol biopolymer transport system component
MTELTGKILGGRYRVEAFLGQGGMADVYKVRDLQRAVFLAMKVLHADLAEDQAFMRNFEREAQTLERLQHPNIVRYYGFEQIHDIAYILMDFIDGLTLRREIFLYKNGLRPGRILEVMQPVCAALYYAHQLGMIHCDIKPANIITHRNGTVYLTDFGIARRSESATQPLTGVGSPAYMAPEQFEEKEPTPAIDIYSLGMVLYEMLTGGQRPFTGESGGTSGNTTKRIIWEKKNTQPPSPRTFNKEITPEMEAVVMVCLQRNPRRRFRSTLDLLQALEVAVRGVQPEDDAQTRVDLPVPGKPARPDRSRGTGELHKTARTPETHPPTLTKPTPPAEKTPAEEKALSTEKKDLQGAGSTLQPAVKPTSAIDKILKAGGKPAPAAANPAAVTAASAPVPDKPVIAPPQPALKKQQIGETPALEALSSSGTPARLSPKTPDHIPDAADSPAQSPVKALAHASAKAPVASKTVETGIWEKIIAWLSRIPRWVQVGAAGLALALVGLAIYSTGAMKPGAEQTSPTQPAAAVVAANTRTSSPLAATPTVKIPPTSDVVAQTATAVPTDLPAVETATYQPTPIGGSERVAFASDRSGSVQVWIMDASNPDNRKQVTNARDGACQPEWSPDGTQIAYTTPCKGPSVYFAGSTIKIVRLSDSQITDLPVKSPGIGGTFDPAWSPDGETLLFTAVLGDKTEIHAINLQDLQVSKLTSNGTKNAQPAWSRDGRFISYIFSDDQNWDALWYMHPNGESKELLSRAGQFSEPAWAPDGMHILASMNKGNNIPTLALFNRADPNAGAMQLLQADTQEFSSGAYRMSHASISPDGQWLVFWTEKGVGKSEIMLASMDGKQVRALTSNDLRDFHPSWSPK